MKIKAWFKLTIIFIVIHYAVIISAAALNKSDHNKVSLKPWKMNDWVRVFQDDDRLYPVVDDKKLHDQQFHYLTTSPRGEKLKNLPPEIETKVFKALQKILGSKILPFKTKEFWHITKPKDPKNGEYALLTKYIINDYPVAVKTFFTKSQFVALSFFVGHEKEEPLDLYGLHIDPTVLKVYTRTWTVHEKADDKVEKKTYHGFYLQMETHETIIPYKSVLLDPYLKF